MKRRNKNNRNCKANNKPLIQGMESRLLMSVSPIEVTTTLDIVDANDNQTSLREAIMIANQTEGEDTILLTGGNYQMSLEGRGDNEGLHGDFDILAGKLNIVSDGTPVSINGGGIDRIFHVHDGAELSLQGMTLMGGKATENGFGDEGTAIGGAILANNATLNLNNVSITGNSAIGQSYGYSASSLQGGHAYGGGIYMTGSQLTASELSLTRNFAIGGTGSSGMNSTSGTHAGDGGEAGGGALYSQNSDVSLYNSLLQSNHATAGNGGLGEASKWSFGLSGNGGDGGRAFGGAIVNDSGVMNLEGVTLDRNFAEAGDAGGTSLLSNYGGRQGQLGLAGKAYGGAVWSGSWMAQKQAPVLNVTASEFTGNEAHGGDAADGVSKFNYSYSVHGQNGGYGGMAYGGAIHVSHSEMNLSNSLISGNRALGGDAGHAGNGASGMAQLHSFSGWVGRGGNGGAALGGGISMVGTYSDVNLEDSDLISNEAVGGLGGDAGNGGHGLLTTLGAWNGTSNAGAGGAGGSGGVAFGGAVYMSQGSFELNRSSVSANSSSGGDGGDGGNAGYNYRMNSTQRSFGGRGGHGGSAFGAGLSLSYGRAQLDASSVNSNIAQSGDGGDGGWAGNASDGVAGNGGTAAGGGLYGYKLNLDSSQTHYSSNIASGGMDGDSYSTTSSKAGNALGGGVYLNSSSAHFYYSDVASNQAQGGDATGTSYGSNGGDASGGGIYAYNTNTSMFGGRIEKNQAQGGLGSTGRSGGGNGGNSAGGGAWFDGELTLTGINIRQNLAKAGNGGNTTYGQAGHGGDATGGGVHHNSGNINWQMSGINQNTAMAGHGGSSYNGTGGNGGDAMGGGFYSTEATVTDEVNFYGNATYAGYRGWGQQLGAYGSSSGANWYDAASFFADQSNDLTSSSSDSVMEI